MCPGQSLCAIPGGPTPGVCHPKPVPGSCGDQVPTAHGNTDRSGL